VSPATAGVEKTQPPVSKVQATPELGDGALSEVGGGAAPRGGLVQAASRRERNRAPRFVARMIGSFPTIASLTNGQ
jgi:hypothetical protein